ncbi:transcription antitermination factor NusB [Candidatus Saccharibacteria bacterium]|nr:transcription antitermination factor NusB [Candidatus Saccharibacteria bacterium]
MEEQEKKRDPRHEARRVALATLFERAFHSIEPKESISRVLELYEESNVDDELLESIVEGVVGKKEEIDKVIAETAPAWPPEQINRVDLVALRIGIWELLFAKETLPETKQAPPKVAIDEAIELSKEFGGAASGGFVNGVLGTVVERFIDGEKREDSDDEIES